MPAGTSHKSVTLLPSSLAILSQLCAVTRAWQRFSVAHSLFRMTHECKTNKGTLCWQVLYNRQGRLKRFNYCNHAARPWIPQRDWFSLERKFFFCNLYFVGGLSCINARLKNTHLWTENVYFFFVLATVQQSWYMSLGLLLNYSFCLEFNYSSQCHIHNTSERLKSLAKNLEVHWSSYSKIPGLERMSGCHTAILFHFGR